MMADRIYNISVRDEFIPIDGGFTVCLRIQAGRNCGDDRRNASADQRADETDTLQAVAGNCVRGCDYGLGM